MRADFCYLCTGCTGVEDIGRQKSSQLIERDMLILMLKKQVELPKYCRQVISNPLSLSVFAFKNVWIAQKAKARAKIIFLKRCLKEDIHHKCTDLDLLLEHQRRKVSTALQEEIQTAPKQKRIRAMSEEIDLPLFRRCFYHHFCFGAPFFLL